MAKETLESVLKARRDDPRALRGAISMVGGKPRIVFGVVGDHRRFSVDIDGDDLKLVDDPRADEAEAVAEPAEEAPEPAAEADAPAEPDEQPEAAAEQPEGGEEAPADTGGKGRSRKGRGK